SSRRTVSPLRVSWATSPECSSVSQRRSSPSSSTSVRPWAPAKRSPQASAHAPSGSSTTTARSAWRQTTTRPSAVTAMPWVRPFSRTPGASGSEPHPGTHSKVAFATTSSMTQERQGDLRKRLRCREPSEELLRGQGASRPTGPAESLIPPPPSKKPGVRASPFPGVTTPFQYVQMTELLLRVRSNLSAPWYGTYLQDDILAHAAEEPPSMSLILILPTPFTQDCHALRESMHQ